MKPKSIGIIGGAGPLAGAFLLERIFSLSREKYNCHNDSDFPQIFLISFPFSDMLSSTINVSALRKELSQCLKQLRESSACVLAIACNTLHAFLDEKDPLSDLVHLPRAVTGKITPSDEPLIFCTSTSARFGLYKQFFPCIYPDTQTQEEVDRIIDQILQGKEPIAILQKLKNLIQTQSVNTVILGCTELSLFAADLSVPNKLIIDPLEIMANKILENSFSNNRM
jgi:aspartate racemase